MVLCEKDPAVPALKAMGEPMYLLRENPTAENIAKHIYLQARELGLDVAEVRLWETSASYAAYREDR
jgi:6-pyruvoyltetrahydropterin/6-carboxytetrahydropterin synthase